MTAPAFPPAACPSLAPATALAELLAHGVPVAPNLDPGELLFTALAHRLERGEAVAAEGALDLLPEGYGFLRAPARDFAPGPHDPFVSVAQVRALNLKPGHWLRGPLRPPRGNERFLGLARIDAVNGAAPERLVERLAFAARTPVLATVALRLPATAPWQALAATAPWRRGHRVHVAAAPGTPQARRLATLAGALAAANAGVRVVVCLLDQPPEDLAAAKATAGDCAEVVGTTFDAPPEQHVALAELALARCQREVEAGHDVALVCDSLTALALAAQRSLPSSGRWLAPGLDAQAVLPGKRLFAAARACAEGGSLTVVATTTAGEPPCASIAAEHRGRGNSGIALVPDGRGGARVDLAGCATRPEDGGVACRDAGS